MNINSILIAPPTPHSHHLKVSSLWWLHIHKQTMKDSV
jgi:hypothetical protein